MHETHIVPYELYELYDWEKVPELYNERWTLQNFTYFTFLLDNLSASFDV